MIRLIHISRSLPVPGKAVLVAWIGKCGGLIVETNISEDNWFEKHELITDREDDNFRFVYWAYIPPRFSLKDLIAKELTFCDEAYEKYGKHLEFFGEEKK